jgi:beta-1,4-mannosyl-glycoprotein beta-1,4-N-acetylglucosaminyltransferase
MKIYDCFIFCGENLLLKIRFDTLYDHVDKFVIVEGSKYFNGDNKPKFFDIEIFKKYEKKIEYHFIDDFPKHNGNNWDFELFQRNKISLGLNDLKADDIILISDADEIPNLKNKKFFEYDSSVFMQNMYYYKFNIHYFEGLKWGNKWPGTKSCKFKYFNTAQDVREFRNKSIPKWRLDRKINRYIEKDGGWHFAYLMNNKDISQKLMRFDHEIKHLYKNKIYEKKKLIDKYLIEDRIKRLIDPYNRSEAKLKKVNIDDSYPKYILENINELKDFIA